MIWKFFPMVKSFVGGSFDIASCPLVGFCPHFLAVRGISGWFYLAQHLFVYFLLGGRCLYCVQFIAAVVTPRVSGSAAAFRLCSGILSALQFAVSLVLLLMKPAVSQPHGRPLAIALQLEAVSGSVRGPACQIPPKPSFLFCLNEKESERALQFMPTSLLWLLEGDSSLPPSRNAY